MKKTTRFVGLDVHSETIAVAVAETGGEIRSLGTIPNRPDAVRRLVKKLGPTETLLVGQRRLGASLPVNVRSADARSDHCERAGEAWPRPR